MSEEEQQEQGSPEEETPEQEPANEEEEAVSKQIEEINEAARQLEAANARLVDAQVKAAALKKLSETQGKSETSVSQRHRETAKEYSEKVLRGEV